MFLCRWKKMLVVGVMMVCALILFEGGVGYVEATKGVKSYVSSLNEAQGGMTLWDTVKSGGIVMAVLGVLSIVAMAIVFYDIFLLKVRKLVPSQFSDEIIEKLGKGDYKGVQYLSHQNKNSIICRVLVAGLDKRKKNVTLAREAMESVARFEIGALWQNISYLSDIATVAPLIGLLGTVLGMIQAFNVIAFQTAVVKPILLAGGVSKAMVTTAGGLIVAIPIMLIYSYFRGKVLEISNKVETYTTDMIRLIEGQEDRV